jgi:hypothetical protein
LGVGARGKRLLQGFLVADVPGVNCNIYLIVVARPKRGFIVSSKDQASGEYVLNFSAIGLVLQMYR